VWKDLKIFARSEIIYVELRSRLVLLEDVRVASRGWSSVPLLSLCGLGLAVGALLERGQQSQLKRVQG
jgi:hypothetical protein